jgi:hypothetical protein
LITINISPNVTGKINVPVHVTANITSDIAIKNIEWLANKQVNFSVSTDQKTINFTPSENGDYVFTITVWDTSGYRASATTGVIVGTVTPQPTPTPTPTPTPSPTTGTVLYDSRVNSKLHDGKVRTITQEGNIECRASGNPKIVVNADKTFSLVTGTQVIDNLSLRSRSRHNEGGECDFRFGGFGTSIHNSSIEFKTESCHNNHENAITKSSNVNIRDGKFHKAIFECKDSGSEVVFNTTLDTIKVGGKHSSPKAFYLDKAKMATKSYFWFRANNDDNGRFYLYVNNYNSVMEVSFRFDSKNSITFQYIVIKAI